MACKNIPWKARKDMPIHFTDLILDLALSFPNLLSLLHIHTMSAANANDIALREPSDWAKWFDAFEAAAKEAKLWKYVNPDDDGGPTLDEPELDDVLGRTTDEMNEFKLKLAIYNAKMAGYRDLGKWVRNSVEATWYGLCFDRDEGDIRQTVKALKTKLAPTANEEKEMVRRGLPPSPEGTHQDPRPRDVGPRRSVGPEEGPETRHPGRQGIQWQIRLPDGRGRSHAHLGRQGATQPPEDSISTATMTTKPSTISSPFSWPMHAL